MKKFLFSALLVLTGCAGVGTKGRTVLFDTNKGVRMYRAIGSIKTHHGTIEFITAGGVRVKATAPYIIED